GPGGKPRVRRSPSRAVGSVGFASRLANKPRHDLAVAKELDLAALSLHAVAKLLENRAREFFGLEARAAGFVELGVDADGPGHDGLAFVPSAISRTSSRASSFEHEHVARWRPTEYHCQFRGIIPR